MATHCSTAIARRRPHRRAGRDGGPDARRPRAPRSSGRAAAGDPLAALPDRDAAWTAAKHTRRVDRTRRSRARRAPRRAPTSCSTRPASPARWTLDPARAPDAVWVSLTPFGLDGPRCAVARVGPRRHGRERQPVLHRRSRPRAGPVRGARRATAHAGGRDGVRRADRTRERTPATRRRLDAGGRRRREHGDAGAVPRHRVPRDAPRRQHRQAPARSGRPATASSASACAAARRASRAWRRSTAPRRHRRRCRAMDWSTFSPEHRRRRDTARASRPTSPRSSPGTRCRSSTTIACETNLMLAPDQLARARSSRARSSRRATSSEPLARRPSHSRVVRHRHGDGADATPRGTAIAGPTGRVAIAADRGAWSGVDIIELGTGAAGPDRDALLRRARRDRAAHRVEEPARLPPRVRARPEQPARPRGRADVRRPQPGKRDVALQPQAPDGRRARAPARRRVGRRGRRELRAARDEGLRPRLRLARRAQARPRDGRARASTARPDRTRTTPASAARAPRSPGTTSSPAGPTASPSAPTAPSPTRSRRASSPPRSPPGCSTAAAPGDGVYLDVSQVEAAIYTLTPWLLEYQATGVARGRAGQRPMRTRSSTACSRAPTTATSADRWVAIAAWTADERDRLLRRSPGADIAAYTSTRRRLDVAETLQAAGIEAVPVQDFGDQHSDPQIAHRGHFVPLTHPFLGPGLYERNGFRSRMRPAATTAPGRPSARTRTGCSASSSASTPTSRPPSPPTASSTEQASLALVSMLDPRTCAGSPHASIWSTIRVGSVGSRSTRRLAVRPAIVRGAVRRARLRARDRPPAQRPRRRLVGNPGRDADRDRWIACAPR